MLNNQINQRLFLKYIIICNKAQSGSYKVVKITATNLKFLTNLKPQTIAENLILLSCSKIVQIIFGDNTKKKVMKNPHLDTRKNTIIHMSDDIETININKLYKIYFALKIDESTDISGIAYVLGFIYFIDENKIVKQFLAYRQFTKHIIIC